MRLTKCFLSLLVIIVAQPVIAWNATGHEAVAAIAWDNMRPATRTKVAAVLSAAVQGDCLHELASTDSRTFFILAATWPDVVRPNNHPGQPPDPRPCTKFHDGDAHFFDHLWSGTSGGTGNDTPRNVTLVLTKPPTTNAIERLIQFRLLVACKKTPCCAPPAERAHDLAWMLHLVGDIHQPLHNAARVTSEPKEHEGDHGGNLLLFKEGTRPSNLHSFWDEIIDAVIPRQSDAEITYINRVIARIQHDHPKAQLAARLESGQFATWSAEGFAAAEEVAYPQSLERGGTPSEQYKTKVFAVADEAIALAGYRLADLLDQMFTQ